MDKGKRHAASVALEKIGKVRGGDESESQNQSDDERLFNMNDGQSFLSGRYKLETGQEEMRMSQWINVPWLTETDTGRVVLDLRDDIWDLRSTQEEGDVIQLKMARYPDGNTEYAIALRPLQNQAVLRGTTYALAELKAALKALK